jgi:SAM-dependent methyltransferase
VTIAPDGSPVDLYALLPDRDEGELVTKALPPPATVLELGCGTGRITRQLVARGYVVTAVDESQEMLAHVGRAEKVCARIEGLDLERRFDAVLLASNLLSTEAKQRQAFLETSLRHSELVIVETLPLGWRPKEGGSSQLGEVSSSVRLESFEAGVARGEVHYEAGGRVWRHTFAMRVFADEEGLRAALLEGGLHFERWLDRERGWFVARGA